MMEAIGSLWCDGTCGVTIRLAGASPNGASPAGLVSGQKFHEKELAWLGSRFRTRVTVVLSLTFSFFSKLPWIAALDLAGACGIRIALLRLSLSVSHLFTVLARLVSRAEAKKTKT